MSDDGSHELHDGQVTRPFAVSGIETRQPAGRTR